MRYFTTRRPTRRASYRRPDADPVTEREQIGLQRAAFVLLLICAASMVALVLLAGTGNPL